MSSTIPIGVRIQKDIYERIKADDPSFNLSEFVRSVLQERYGSVESQVDSLLKKLEG